MGFEGWEGCGPLAVLLAPAPIDPTLSWPAGHSPPCFLGHPAQLFGDQADIKGVLGVEIMPGSIVGAPGSAAIAEVIWEGAGVGLVRVRS